MIKCCWSPCSTHGRPQAKFKAPRTLLEIKGTKREWERSKWYLHRPRLAGKSFNAFPETSSDFSFESRPIESGNSFNWLCCRSSTSKFTRPAIESGRNYPHRHTCKTWSAVDAHCKRPTIKSMSIAFCSALVK